MARERQSSYRSKSGTLCTRHIIAFTKLILDESHHPPATAYHISNEEHGVTLEGYNAQKASFTKTIHIKQIGHAVYKIAAFNETYVFSLPNLHIEGLILGSPFVELNDKTYMTSSSGFTAKIDYAGKGWVSGKKNSFTATLYPTGKEKNTLYTINGQWTKSFEIREGGSKGNVVETYDTDSVPISPLTVAPIEQQDPLESHRAWQKVAAGVAAGNMDIVGSEKSRIENEQRALRSKEKAEGRVWERRYFTNHTSDDILNSLGPQIGLLPEADKTGGIWRFDRQKAAKWQNKNGQTQQPMPQISQPAPSTYQPAPSTYQPAPASTSSTYTPAATTGSTPTIGTAAPTEMSLSDFKKM